MLRTTGPTVAILVVLLLLRPQLLMPDLCPSIDESNSPQRNAVEPATAPILPSMVTGALLIPNRLVCDTNVRQAHHDEPESNTTLSNQARVDVIFRDFVPIEWGSGEIQLLDYEIVDPGTTPSRQKAVKANDEGDARSADTIEVRIDTSSQASSSDAVPTDVDIEASKDDIDQTLPKQKGERHRARVDRIAVETSENQLATVEQSNSEQSPNEISQENQSADQKAVDQFPAEHMYGSDWLLDSKSFNQKHRAQQQRIRRTLDFYYARPLNSKEDSPWSMMHWLIAWGQDSQMYVGRPGGRLVYTLDWLCMNKVCEGARLLTLQNGNLRPKNGPGLQGHDGQLLAILAQARVDISQTIQVAGQVFDINDLIHVEQLGCRKRTELTFQLIGLSHYLDSDATWQNKKNAEWSIAGLIKEEIAQQINGVTCGGTHRLMGLHYATRMRVAERKPLNGQWARADKYIKDYQNYALSLQNRDGTFSSDFFKGKATWGDLDRKIKTTGHVLELLVFSLPSDRLIDSRISKSVDYLCNTLLRNRYYVWPKGPLSHALRALSLYEERVHGVPPGPRDVKMAPPSEMPRITKTPDSDESRPLTFGIFRSRRR